jgi:hypothetical protein
MPEVSLQDHRDGLDEAGKTILTNWEGLERRLKELEQRVETLN